MSSKDNKNNKDNGDDGKVKEAKTRQLLAASALVPLLCALSQPANFKPLIYTIFIINYLIKTRSKEEPAKKEPVTEKLEKILAESQPSAKAKLSLWQKLEFVALFVACGMIVQILDYLGHLSFPQHATWSPSWIYFSPPGPSVVWQFIMTFRIMVALSLTWLVALRFFVFSEIEFVKIAVGFGVALTLVDHSPIYSLPSIVAATASAIYYGSIAGIAATPLALPKTNSSKGNLPNQEKKLLLTAVLLFAAVKLVIHLTPIPAALGGG